MPPLLPRKRLRSPTPEDAGPSKPSGGNKNKAGPAPTPRKPTLFDDLDAGTSKRRTVQDAKALLERMAATDDESSLSSLSEDEFEDVPIAKRQKLNNTADDDEEDEDMEFEDVETYTPVVTSAPAPSGDLELTLTRDTRVNITNPFGTKKGPSKIERQIRRSTHQAHVQFLMYHNAVRNAWLCNKEIQDILVKQLPKSIADRVAKWRRDSGLPARDVQVKPQKGKATLKGKGKKGDARSQRDWGAPAQRLAEGEVNMSGGDPLFRMLEHLVEYWKRTFRITAPGLRKLGYMSLQRLDEESKSFKEDKYDPEWHGERIRSLAEFREHAKMLEGSRDVGAQLFTALLRGLGLETRLVASLQPVGFAWSQNEEAAEKNPRVLKKQKTDHGSDSSSDEDPEDDKVKAKSISAKNSASASSSSKTQAAAKRVTKVGKRTRSNGAKDAPIDLSESEEPGASSSDDSIIDVTPARRAIKPSLPYDRDLKFPHYWSEVLSPVTNTFTAVDAVTINTVASNSTLLSKFEPRGNRADKAKQVIAYVIGYSSDGTAKDVTTRYLQRQMWPGRTKGFRFPIEKIPIYDKNGKVKRYEHKDWFKTVMSGYVRGSKQCPRTEIDDHEDMTDLKPAKVEKKEVPEGKETLQYYKTSPDFVLERYLKREEALVPGAQHVKMFTVKGKGEDSTEEKVFRRKDVVNCKSMETWHKEGRAPKPGEEPLKRVPYRAATTNRRRELAEAENASGEKVLQGLFSRAQTEWIIPPPIENGIIPKNSFGNIDLYVDSMLPEGAVHLPYRGMVKICKRLDIDYAEAVTGFEFGHRMAVPVITGVVVAEEHEETIMEEWEKEEAERVRKEDEKRQKVAIHMWRKMLMGMRIIERVRAEYGDLREGEEDLLNPWMNKDRDVQDEKQKERMELGDEEMGGGFLPEGMDVEEPVQERRKVDPAENGDMDEEGDEEEEDEEAGGFVVEGDDRRSNLINGGQHQTNQTFEFASRGIEGEDEDEEMQDMPSSPPPRIAQSKARGHPQTKTKKPTPTPKKQTPTSAKARGKRKVAIPDIDDEAEDEEDESTLSDPESEPEFEIKEKPSRKLVALAKKIPANKRTPAKRSLAKVATPAKSKAANATSTKGGGSSQKREIPSRSAKKKSETALRSHYFGGGGDDDEDDEEGEEEDDDESHGDDE